VTVHLEHAAAAVELFIRDDGQGFRPEQIPSGHYGLAMMHERAEDAGLVLSVASRPGHGTEINIHWTKKAE
jgi:nitrate/nitrite-specific signal transduction histidine kinase